MNSFLWALVTSLIWGVVPLLEKAGLSSASPLAGLFYRCLGVVAGMTVFGLGIFNFKDIRAVGTRSAILLMLGGLLASFAGQICFYNALKAGEVSRVVIIAGSYPLMTFLLGVLLFNESISPLKIAGAVLVGAGLVLLKTR